MAYVALVTLLILIQYFFFVMQAGFARDKDTVVAPATTGDEMYERKSRMWVCAHYFRADVAAILGLTFLIGRFMYSHSYIKEPKSRAPGFIIGFFANVVLIGCSLYGVITSLV